MQLHSEKKKHGPSKHLWSNPKRAGSKKRALQPTAFNRAALLAFLWAPEHYPGLTRGMMGLLGNRVTRQTIQRWRSGKRKAPQWAIGILVEHLRNTAGKMLAAADELEKEKAPN